MGYGSSARDCLNLSYFRVVLSEKDATAGIKGNDCCRDAGDERMGRYDAGILRKFRLPIDRPTNLRPIQGNPSGLKKTSKKY